MFVWYVVQTCSVQCCGIMSAFSWSCCVRARDLIGDGTGGGRRPRALQARRGRLFCCIAIFVRRPLSARVVVSLARCHRCGRGCVRPRGIYCCCERRSIALWVVLLAALQLLHFAAFPNALRQSSPSARPCDRLRSPYICIHVYILYSRYRLSDVRARHAPTAVVGRARRR